MSGTGNRLYRRSSTRLPACPTDDQAEVLVHRTIPIADVVTVAVATETAAARAHAALDQIGATIETATWAVAPVLFNASSLSAAVAAGQRPAETPWQPA
ncbi:DarT ssDNA thymidine ADP-ribosyltransferase family protein [Conexibacter sp. CPCC 206217]|uniref:DarT ssDNA thymidine ADP-ribosyltransferase family protein n=1 Tax=Conexibacter sp. CPCC 206217 TaxID=3064574 RepID=UPI0027266612|nr:DarT ssDNA thymidine ADP-ribosyltransferase family protein [Conexibacter sp. CPCC 206217]MDO8211008.1 DarT ssDNA thymidine ADP-ribosyltransferase family protein [Conexibacter sp. CPCC 206217]